MATARRQVYVHFPMKRISCLRQTGLRAPPFETNFMPSADRFTCTSYETYFCLRSPVAYAPELQRRGSAIAYGDGTQTALRALSYETSFSLRLTGLCSPSYETSFHLISLLLRVKLVFGILSV
jgi:hypothetical protein